MIINKNIGFMLLAAAGFFSSCTKHEPSTGDPIPAGYKGYVQLMTYEKNRSSGISTAPNSYSYNSDYAITAVNFPGIHYRYNAQKQIQNTTITIYRFPNNWSIDYAVHYDVNNLPVSGSRTGPKEGITGNLIDSIEYKTTNGQLTEMRVFDRKQIIVNNFPFRIDTTYFTGTFETYTLSYLNDQISKVRFVEKTGKIIDFEFTYGPNKGPVADARVKYLLTPDMLTNTNFLNPLVFNQAKNELLKIKKTFVTENNRVEEVIFTYTYNKYKYPASADVVDSNVNTASNINGGVYRILFEYQ